MSSLQTPSDDPATKAAGAPHNLPAAQRFGRRVPDQAGARRRLPFGIKAQLFVAFFVIAAMTAVASAVAWYAFADIERAVRHIIADTIPGMASSLRLAEKSAEIAATAPGLMASATQEERVVEQLRLEQRAEEIVALIDGLASTGVGQDIAAGLSGIAVQITSELRLLDAAVERGLELEAQRERATAALAVAHDAFLDALEPLADDAVFDLVISGEEATSASSEAITALVEGGVTLLHRLLTINAEANLAAGLLSEAGQVADPALLQPIRERFVAAAAAIERNLRQLPASAQKRALRQDSIALLAPGRGAHNLFEVRGRELRAADATREAMAVMRKQMVERIHAAHEALLFALTSLIDDAVFDLVITSERKTEESRQAFTQLLDVGMNTLHVLLTLRGEGNLAASLLAEGASVSRTSSLQPLRERLVAATGRIERMIGQLPAPAAARLGDLATAITGFGTGGDGLLDLRREELRENAAAQASLEASRGLALRLGTEVAQLVTEAHRSSDAAALRSADAIAGGKWLLLLITAISAAGAALIVLFYVVPRVVRPIEATTEAMTRLASGDTTVAIPGRDRNDEIGAMAHALGVFRDTAVEVQKSNLREIRETRRRLTDAIESITEGFSLYDRDDRLVVYNNQYRALLYPEFSDDEIKPGMSFEAIVRNAAERGYVQEAEGRVEEWLQERLARHRNPSGPHVQRRSDGCWVQVSERKTEDGGTVAVYSDISEIKDREEELAQKSRDLENLASQLAKYLSPQVYESIFTGRQEVKIASQRKKLTIFFSDIVSFTETADRLESEELTQLLNTFLTEMSQIAMAHGATIDKYVGDAIVIFFGDPETRGVKEDAVACVEMAIAMRRRLRDLALVWRNSGLDKPLRVRIGINTGYCTVGNFGSEDRMDYTIIGGGVNLASRLESEAEPDEILISYETYAHVRDRIHCEERGEINVKGIAYPVATYRVIDDPRSLGRSSRRIKEEQPHLQIDLDPEAMSAGERVEAAAALQRALAQLSDRGKPIKS